MAMNIFASPRCRLKYRCHPCRSRDASLRVLIRRPIRRVPELRTWRRRCKAIMRPDASDGRAPGSPTPVKATLTSLLRERAAAREARLMAEQNSLLILWLNSWSGTRSSRTGTAEAMPAPLRHDLLDESRVATGSWSSGNDGD